MTEHDAGVLDTSVVAALKLFDVADVPERVMITAVTLGELSGAAVQARPNDL